MIIVLHCGISCPFRNESKTAVSPFFGEPSSTFPKMMTNISGGQSGEVVSASTNHVDKQLNETVKSYPVEPVPHQTKTQSKTNKTLLRLDSGSTLKSSTEVTKEESYISKVELGSLVAKEKTVCHLQSVTPHGVLGKESPTTMLTVCPLWSNVPGMPSLLQSSVILWPEDNRLLLKTLLNKRMPVLFHSNYFTLLENACDDIPKMVAMAPSSTRSSCIPGFPSALKPDIVCLFGTCPSVCTIPGLPSLCSDTGDDKHVWEACSLWEKPLEQKQIFSDIHQVQENSEPEMMRLMVCLLPTCCKKASVPGFPSAVLQNAQDRPSMVSLLPTCPNQTNIAGMSCRQSLIETNDNWHFLKGLTPKRTPRCNLIIPPETQKDDAFLKHMVNILPSCPCVATIPGFSSAPRKKPTMTDFPAVARGYPSMADMFPSCPLKNTIIGFPSKELVCTHDSTNKDWLALKCLNNVKQKKFNTKTQAYILHWFPDEGEMSRGMVSCPQKSTVFGLPSALQRKSSMVNLLPSCPRQSAIPGFPSKTVCLSFQKEWLLCKNTEFQTPQKKRESLLLSQYNNKGNLIMNMAYMLPSCPHTACLPGFPSLSGQILEHIPNIVCQLPTCPRHSRVYGTPSMLHSDSHYWSIDKGSICEKPSRVVIYDQKTYSTGKLLGKIMVSMLPPCPKKSVIYGIPSKGCQIPVSERKSPQMVGSLETFPEHSSIPGLPSKKVKWYKTWNFKYPIWENRLIKSHEGHFNDFTVEDLAYCEKTAMISMLSSCPHEALNPGFPSAPRSQTACDLTQSMVQWLPSCPRQSAVVGFPSKQPFPNSDSYLSPYEELRNEKFLLKTSKPIIFHCPGATVASQRQAGSSVSIVASCPKKSLIPGLPSTQVQLSEQPWPGKMSVMVKSTGNQRENLSNVTRYGQYRTCTVETNDIYVSAPSKIHMNVPCPNDSSPNNVNVHSHSNARSIWGMQADDSDVGKPADAEGVTSLEFG